MTIRWLFGGCRIENSKVGERLLFQEAAPGSRAVSGGAHYCAAQAGRSLAVNQSLGFGPCLASHHRYSHSGDRALTEEIILQSSVYLVGRRSEYAAGDVFQLSRPAHVLYSFRHLHQDLQYFCFTSMAILRRRRDPHKFLPCLGRR